MKRNSGFSLVELLITVALLTVLASLAMAQFKLYTERSINAQLELYLRDLYNAAIVIQSEMPEPVAGGAHLFQATVSIPDGGGLDESTNYTTTNSANQLLPHLLNSASDEIGWNLIVQKYGTGGLGFASILSLDVCSNDLPQDASDVFRIITTMQNGTSSDTGSVWISDIGDASGYCFS